jgi:hypothetical protein
MGSECILGRLVEGVEWIRWLRIGKMVINHRAVTPRSSLVF